MTLLQRLIERFRNGCRLKTRSDRGFGILRLVPLPCNQYYVPKTNVLNLLKVLFSQPKSSWFRKIFL